MKNHRLFLLVLFFISLFCSTCKKKTTIKVKVFNYALNEPIANATVALVERKLSGGLFAADYSCEELMSLQTDANGECSFNEEKLRDKKKYTYFFGITNAYGLAQSYPCGGKSSGFIKVGGAQTTILNLSSFNGFIKIRESNLLNPSQNGDSLILLINSSIYNLPNDNNPQGGGGVLNSYSYYGDKGYPYPGILNSNEIETPCGIKIVKVRKRKMGVVTTSVDTVKIYPNETKIIEINW
jgi:hypothetical protein